MKPTASINGVLRGGYIAVLAGAASILLTGGGVMAAECRKDPGPSVDWSACKKRMLMLDNSNFEAANLSTADFSMTDLSKTNLKKANLTKATLVRASLAGAQAEGANFERAEGYRSNLSGISAAGSSFVSSEMQRSNFSEADLHDVDFTKAELGRAVFSKAQLANTRFSMANLSRAIFHDATVSGPMDFTNAFLYLTRIEGVDLSAATGLTGEQVKLACGDEATKLPGGIERPTEWPCADE